MRRIFVVAVLLAVMVGGCAGDARPVVRASISGSPSPGAVADATPAAAPPENLETLKENLAMLSAGWSGRIAIGVTDLQTGQSISINGSERLSAASTIKIFVTMVIAQDIDAGRYPASDVDDLMHAMMG